MRLRAAALAASALLAGCVGGAPPAAQTPSAPAPVPPFAAEAVVLATHTQLGLLEMDGYVERAGLLWRPTPVETANLSAAMVWNTAQPTEYDYTYTHVGPFAKGTQAGFTLGQYLAARAAVAYVCQGGKATYDLSGAQLVPNGLYTLWVGQARTEKGLVVNDTALPAGATDGTENAFRADAQGAAGLHVADAPCQASTVQDAEGTGVMSYVALALHTDGRTWGAEPGPFGNATHIQMFGVVQAKA